AGSRQADVVRGRSDLHVSRPIGGGARLDGSARWRGADRKNVGRGRLARVPHIDELGRPHFGLDRSLESISHTAPRWRTPFVLPHRGGAGTTVVRARSGGGIPDRARNHRHVDDFYGVERRLTPGIIVRSVTNLQLPEVKG